MKTVCLTRVVVVSCALVLMCASASAATVTYNIAYVSTDPVSTDPSHTGAFAGSITLEAADIAAHSATPFVDSFQAKLRTFSGPAQNATYDAAGNLYSIGLSNTNGISTFIMHGNFASPGRAEWDVTNISVPLQKLDYGTYQLTLAPEPSMSILVLLLILHGYPRKHRQRLQSAVLRRTA